MNCNWWQCALQSSLCSIFYIAASCHDQVSHCPQSDLTRAGLTEAEWSIHPNVIHHHKVRKYWPSTPIQLWSHFDGGCNTAMWYTVGDKAVCQYKIPLTLTGRTTITTTTTDTIAAPAWYCLHRWHQWSILVQYPINNNWTTCCIDAGLVLAYSVPIVDANHVLLPPPITPTASSLRFTTARHGALLVNSI